MDTTIDTYDRPSISIYGHVSVNNTAGIICTTTCNIHNAETNITVYHVNPTIKQNDKLKCPTNENKQFGTDECTTEICNKSGYIKFSTFILKYHYTPYNLRSQDIYFHSSCTFNLSLLQ